MKKLLIAIFLVLILAFGIVGYTQNISKSGEQIEQTDASFITQS